MAASRAGIIQKANSTNRADYNADGQINFFDVLAFVSAFQDQADAADFNADGVFNFFDFTAYIQAFNAGCP